MQRVVAVKNSIAQAKHSKPAKLALEYEGGSECDIEDVVRGTSVEITCGERFFCILRIYMMLQ